MIIEKIQKICGAIPEGFIRAQPEGNTYIFQKDPNYLPITLKDFMGNLVTVNSFEECYYYVELGFGIDVFSINDLIKLLIIFIPLITLVIIIKINFIKIRSFFINSKLFNEPKFYKSLLIIFVIYEIFIVFTYVSNKSAMLRPFIDEYVSLASNYNFFTRLDFNAGGFLGGTHSKYLTSGPISALGSSIGWFFTSDFYVARVANYFWIIILNSSLLYFVGKNKNFDLIFGFIFSISMFLLIPWWQGILYGLGEITSMIVFTNAIFLFSRYRRASLGLFAISIFLGKLLTAVPFAAFYIITFFKDKSIKRVSQDIFFFLMPLMPWFLLINIKYSQGNAIDFLIDTINFVLYDNSASGLNNSSSFNYENIKLLILSSEFQYWNLYEKLRLGLIPILFTILLFKNISNIDSQFGKITIPLASSVVLHYLWFWLISPLKWMRYSQHFTVVIVITLFYLILFNLLSSKFDYFYSFALIGMLLDNDETNFLILITILFLIIFLFKKSNWLQVMKFALSLVIILDLSISVNKSNQIQKNIKIESCTELLISDNCRNEYLKY